MYSLTENELANRTAIVNNLSREVSDFNCKNFISLVPADNDLLLLGECTHGTHEFYKIRSEITKHLIENNGYKFVLIEAEWPCVYEINKFINKKTNQYSSIQELLDKNMNKFPTWMWNNSVIADLISWLKEYNANEEDEKKRINMFGIDCQQFNQSYVFLEQFLKNYDKDFYEIITKNIGFLKQFSTEHHYAHEVVNGNMKKYINHIPLIMQELLSTYQWEHVDKLINNNREDYGKLIDIIASEQNMEIIVNGEEYFRKMLTEPRGSQASWNTRDQHMLTTIMRIRNRFQEISDEIPKIVVWAHNSHIGNSNATNRGGKTFTENNTWNLGQMAKEIFPNTYSIGFYTDTGTLTAGKGKNETAIQEINKANCYSYEYIFSLVCSHTKMKQFLINLRNFKTRERVTDNKSIIISEQIPGTYRCLYSGKIFNAVKRITENNYIKLVDDKGETYIEYCKFTNISRRCLPIEYLLPENTVDYLNTMQLQRWIGVNYMKSSELDSHYGESCMPEQYDSIGFIESTTHI